MEFGLREWLILIGVVVIVGVLLDGTRRVRSGARGKIKMSLDKSAKVTEKDKTDYFNAELPNGGARSVKRTVNEGAAAVEAFDVAHELRPDPLFADEVSDEVVDEESQTPLEVTAQADAEIESEAEAAEDVVDETGHEAAVQEESASYQDVEEVIVINVFSLDDSGFKGADLMRVILACGMRYGDMSIFHRTEEGDKAIQFSMANVVKPGIFDLDTIDGTYTPGVTFFLSLPGPKDSLKAFDYMHETAQCVVKNLNGELKDEMHSAMTLQTIEHSRQKIRDYERRQLSLLR
jgi:cell division protein ZipA